MRAVQGGLQAQPELALHLLGLSFRNLGDVRRRVGRAAMFGVLAGLATAAVAVAVRPRGGTGVLVDWDDVRSAARAHLDQPATSGTVLAAAEKRYRAMAGELEKPLLDFVGRLPVGVQMARCEAVDRDGWLDLNVAILRRVIGPVLE